MQLYQYQYSCTGSGYLDMYLYICIHARGANLHAGALERAREILYAFPLQAVEIGTEPIKTIDICSGQSDYVHEPISYV